MEKSITVSSSNSLKEVENGGRSATNGVIKAATDPYSWGNGTDQESLGDGGELLGGFSWPPRSYTCTFCKREFRSAQALGGHMNVHRRDRARLRQVPSSRDVPQNSYSLLNLNLDPNPNPNPNLEPIPNFSSYLSSTPTIFPSMLPPLISAPPSPLPSSTTHPRGSANLTMMKSQITSFGVNKYEGFLKENESRVIRRSKIIRLNLEIGLLGESKADDLDLELRLGCS